MKTALLKFFKGITLLTLVGFILLNIFLMFIIYHTSHEETAVLVFGFTLLVFGVLINLPFAYKYAQAIYKDSKLGKSAKVSYLLLIILLRIIANTSSVSGTIAYSHQIGALFNGILPITDRVYTTFERRFEAYESNGVIEQSIEDYGIDRLDMDRIAASNYRVMMNEYEELAEYNGSGVRARLGSRLRFDPTRRIVYSDSILTSYDEIWGDYIPRDEMCDHLYFVLEQKSAINPRFEIRIEKMLEALDGENPRFSKHKGDYFAERDEIALAQEWYGKYISLCENSGVDVESGVVEFVNNRREPSEVQDKLFSALLDVVPQETFASVRYLSDDAPTIHLSGKGEVGYCYTGLSLMVFGGEYWDSQKRDYSTMEGAITIANRIWRSESYGEPKGFEKISGVPIFTTPVDSSFFPYYNSEFIRWVQRALVPDPSDLLGRNSYQKMYDVLFKERVRSLYLGYVYLQDDSRNLRQLKANYELAIASDDEYAGQYYIHGTFSDVYLEEIYISTSIGTLLRRSIDGSYDSVVSLLFTILNKYDERWMEDINRRYQVAFG